MAIAWSKVRLTSYLVATLTMFAAMLQWWGLADVDWQTHMVDLKPFNIELVAGAIAGLGASVLALLANWFGWKTKPRKGDRQ